MDKSIAELSNSECINILSKDLVKFSKYPTNYIDIKKLLDYLHGNKEKGGRGLNITEIANLFRKDRRTISTWFWKLGLNIKNSGPIKIGELVEFQTNPYITKEDNYKIRKIPFVANPDLLWACGFSLGEGAHSSGTLEVGNTNFKFLPALNNIFKKYGSTSVFYDSLHNECKIGTTFANYNKNVPKSESNYFRVRLYNSAFGRMIKNEFSPINKDTVRFAFSKDKWAKCFIAGLWNADGWIFWKTYKRKRLKWRWNELSVQIGISQKENEYSKWLIQELRFCLERLFGIRTRFIKGNINSTIIKKGEKYYCSGKSIGLVTTTKKDKIKWLRIFKNHLKHEDKIKKANTLLKIMNSKRKRDHNE